MSNILKVIVMVQINNKVLIPLDGSVNVEYTGGGSVCVNDEVILGRFSYEAGHPLCNPKGLCIVVELSK